MTVTSTQQAVQGNGGAPFDITRRGYDRDQVDAQLAELHQRLAAAESARRAAEQHALSTEQELRTVRSNVSEPAMSQESFGFRAEKILRLAEHEAADVRGRAGKEATALVEQARAEAERHRHEVEQTLIVRAAELDQEAAQRDVTIREREQQSAAVLAGAREEATRITEDAQRAADTLVTEARNRAEEIRHRSEQDSRRRRDAAEQELKRIGGIHESVRAEMARLHKTLAGELEKQTPAEVRGTIPTQTGK